MKKIILSAAVLSLGTILAMAEEQKSNYSVTVDFPYTSKYTFRGQELGKDALQPSIEATVSDFYFGVWTNQPITKNADNEFDFYAGYKAKLNDAWSVDGGGTIYYYPEMNASSGNKRSTFEPYVGINGNIKGVTPGVYVYRDIDLKTTTLQGQVGYSFPMPQAGLTLDLSANLGRVFADHGAEYNYVRFDANLPYKLTDKATIYAGAAYTNSDANGVKKDLLSYTVGLSVAF